MGGKVGRERCPLISPKCTPKRREGSSNLSRAPRGAWEAKGLLDGEAFLAPRWRQPEVPELAPGGQH